MSSISLVPLARPKPRRLNTARLALVVAALLTFAQLFAPIMISPAAAAGDLELVTSSSNRTDGWALYDINGRTHRQWVNTTCRNQLVAAGAVLQIVNYGAEIGVHPKTTAWKQCNQLADLIGADDPDPDPEPGDFRLVTSTNTRTDGWALYDINGRTHRQWVNAACRNQLVAAGSVVEIVNYGSQIGVHPKTTAWKQCDQLEDLIGSDAPEPGDPPRERIVRGTLGSTAMSLGPNPDSNAIIAQQRHGTRIYCTVSHLSYDDPVVFPNQPGAAHLHTFWGNTKADSTTTTAASLAGGATSCEGGTNNQSSYWMPTLFDAHGRAALPESIFVYYKSFFSQAYNGNRNLIQPVPNGLQMLAKRSIGSSDAGDFRVEEHNGGVQLVVKFPDCVRVRANGTPVLSSNSGGERGRNSHLEYSRGSNRTANECPASHPYRIPGLEYIVRYSVSAGSNWSLASDMPGQQKGSSLHADYIARWDATSMNTLVRCNRDMRPQCEFAGRRAQLADRFVAPDGTRVYNSSVRLVGSRTPFGTTLPKMYQ